jgi:hypothetical protein
MGYLAIFSKSESQIEQARERKAKTKGTQGERSRIPREQSHRGTKGRYRELDAAGAPEWLQDIDRLKARDHQGSKRYLHQQRAEGELGTRHLSVRCEEVKGTTPERIWRLQG